MFTRRNLITYLIALFIILTLNFLLPRMMPGDPLLAIYGDEALVQMSPQLKADLMERFALDQSLWKQFISYWAALFRGDLGYSYAFNAPVITIILERLPWTLLLTGLALILSTALGILLGVESGWRRGKPLDSGLLSGMVAISGFPDFFLGILFLLLFAVSLKILPLFGAESAYSGLTGLDRFVDITRHLILPLCALVFARVTGAYLLTRNTMIGIIREPYILLARAKGLIPATVRYRHAARNALLPVITQTGIWLGLMITAALFIEIVFAYPGMGLLTYDAIGFRDYPVLQGLLLVSAFFVLSVNFLIDLFYPKIDPRVSHAR
jgi:peptide/nickel transport system permease protein